MIAPPDTMYVPVVSPLSHWWRRLWWRAVTAIASTATAVIGSATALRSCCCGTCYELRDCEDVGNRPIVDNDLSLLIGKRIKADGKCWIVVGEAACSSPITVSTPVEFPDCESCLLVCYTLSDCQGLLPDKIVRNPFAAIVGQVVRLDGNCWDVSLAPDCSGNTFVFADAIHSDCDDCWGDYDFECLTCGTDITPSQWQITVSGVTHCDCNDIAGVSWKLPESRNGTYTLDQDGTDPCLWIARIEGPWTLTSHGAHPPTAPDCSSTGVSHQVRIVFALKKTGSDTTLKGWFEIYDTALSRWSTLPSSQFFRASTGTSCTASFSKSNADPAPGICPNGFDGFGGGGTASGFPIL